MSKHATFEDKVQAVLKSGVKPRGKETKEEAARKIVGAMVKKTEGRR